MPTSQYLPPPYPPPEVKPLLRSSSTVPYDIDLNALAFRGWETLPLTYSDPLYKAFSDLFKSSAQFFNLPQGSKDKYKIPVKKATEASEEGYSLVAGEKSLITLRKMATIPTEFDLRNKAAKAWRQSGETMRNILRVIEESLEMESGVLQRTTGPKIEMPDEGEENVATLLRMFRYERPLISNTGESGSVSARVVAEAHKDLGLLSLVVGHTPGLECWDASRNSWNSCEEGKATSLTATVLVGQTLAKFTNWRYAAGRHRVFVRPMLDSISGSETTANESSEALLTDPKYRFSLVHALRAHLPLTVSSSDFETRVTGMCPSPLRFSNVTIAEIYRAISDAHWNINIDQKARRKQERQVSVSPAALSADLQAIEINNNVEIGIGSDFITASVQQPVQS